MVRNWQNRVEMTKARRRQTQEKKADMKEKRQNKIRVHEFMTTLDACHRSAGRAASTITTIQVWTDAIPKHGLSLSDMVVGGVDGSSSSGGGGGGSNHYHPEEGKHGNKRGRGKNKGKKGAKYDHDDDDDEDDDIILEETPKKGGRRRGNSNADIGKKKAHPRSKEAEKADNAEGVKQDVEVPLLCRSFFFTGKCVDTKGGKNAHNCRYKHYVNKIPSLSQALQQPNKSTTSNEETASQLDLADQALFATLTEEAAFSDPDGMDMLYYTPIIIYDGRNNNGSSSDETTNKISDEVTHVFSKSGIPQSSIVYIVIRDTLVFDRYREGSLLSEDDFHGVFGNKNKGGDAQQQQLLRGNQRTTSIGSEGDYEMNNTPGVPEEETESLASFLPGIILEHILTYSSDETVAAASRVCKSWYYEIGQNSPNLWKHLQKRHEWPTPAVSASTDATSTAEDMADGDDVHKLHLVYRDAFLSHYSVVRDVTAIKTALTALTSNKRSAALQTEQTEMTYQDFATRKHAPVEPNICFAIHVWSPTRVLAAYPKECSLRLFESVASAKGDGGEKACRELVCQKIDPYKTTKRKNCEIVAMDLDEHAIGCVCRVMTNGVESPAHILVVVSRDDFLLGDSSDAGMTDEPALKVIEIGETVLNYLVSADEVDHRMLHLRDFLADGHETDEVEVLVSRSVAACGFGNFMLEIAVSIPSEDLGGQMLLLDRKLVLFSTSASTIVWVGDTDDPSRPLRPRSEDMTLVKMELPRPVRSKAACTLAVASPVSAVLRVIVIDPSEGIHTLPVEASGSFPDEILAEEWDVPAIVFQCRPVIITELDVVATVVLHQRVADRVIGRKTIVSFYSRFPAVGELACRFLELVNVEVIRLVRVRENHAIAVCRMYKAVSGEEEGDDEPTASLYAILFDIAARQEIGRILLLDDLNTNSIDDNWLEIASGNGGTIGAGLSWKGMIMTGDDVRSVGAVSVTLGGDEHTSKKKSKKMLKKSVKKSLFARGKNT